MRKANGRGAVRRYIDGLLADRHVIDQQLNDALRSRFSAELAQRDLERNLAAESHEGVRYRQYS